MTIALTIACLIAIVQTARLYFAHADIRDLCQRRAREKAEHEQAREDLTKVWEELATLTWKYDAAVEERDALHKAVNDMRAEQMQAQVTTRPPTQDEVVRDNLRKLTERRAAIPQHERTPESAPGL